LFSISDLSLFSNRLLSIHMFRFYFIKFIGIYCVINNAYNKLGLGEGSQSQTHRIPSCVPRWEIGIHNDRHLSWDWYIWIVVPHFLPTCATLKYNFTHVDKQIHTIISWIWIWYSKQFYMEYKVQNKTSRNNCLIICLWQILVNNPFVDVSIFTTISLQFSELILTGINQI
jgi:hypothetical protein